MVLLHIQKKVCNGTGLRYNTTSDAINNPKIHHGNCDLLLAPDCIVVAAVGELKHLRVVHGLKVSTLVFCRGSGGSVDLLVYAVPVSRYFLRRL